MIEIALPASSSISHERLGLCSTDSVVTGMTRLTALVSEAIYGVTPPAVSGAEMYAKTMVSSLST